MRALNLRSLLVTVVVFGGPAAAAAQRPTPDQAQQMLQNNPALIQQLQQRIATSGMTPDQIRARLRAAGYPENMLDAYLPSGSGTTASAASNGSDIFAAVRQLGIADSLDAALMRCGINPDTLTLPVTTDTGATASAAGDSVRRTYKSQLLKRACGVANTLVAQDSLTQMQRDSGLVLFGVDFFRKATNLFDPNAAAAVDANYRLGPGDQLVLILTGDVEASYSLEVTREGFVVIPQVGQITVNNLTLGQLEDILYARLGRVYSGVRRGPGATTHFAVSVARIRSNLVYVTGDVQRPGAYQIPSTGTLLNALYAAGGPTDEGSLRDVQLRRGGVLIDHMDFYDYMIHGDASHDARLETGDVVFIPVHLPRVRVVGEVTRPATYEMKPTETLADALHFAGGFTAAASRARVQVDRTLPPSQRVDGHDRITMDVVSDALVTGAGPAVPVQPGDVIRVFRVTAPVHDRVYVAGDVNSPGIVGLTPGMRVADALRLAGGVRPDAYLGQVLVTRLQPDSTRQQLRVSLRDTLGAVVHDIPLQENDEIQVFSTTEFRPQRYVAIDGAVHKSGQFPYREGMTVRDLILMAGGLDQSADLTQARIARLPESRLGGTTAHEFAFPLDSSYLFERGVGGTYLGPPGLPASSGPTPDVPLLPYDNVLILRQPGWELQRTVAVAGQVRYPGRYTLLSTTERLTDVLERAGGLTPEAYANGVTFYRTKDGIGRIGVDLPDVLAHRIERDNLLLQDGDSIYIPRYTSVVRVEGAVNSPVAVTWVPGRDLNYYIRAAGGTARNADAKRAYVTQPNGKVDAEASRFLLPSHIPEPGPGSVVYVPTKDPNVKPTDPIAVAGALGGILSSLVAITIALRR